MRRKRKHCSLTRADGDLVCSGVSQHLLLLVEDDEDAADGELLAVEVGQRASVALLVRDRLLDLQMVRNPVDRVRMCGSRLNDA